MRIITEFVGPTARDRRFDWCAYHECDAERGLPHGWGSTEAEAVADLERRNRVKRPMPVTTQEEARETKRQAPEWQRGGKVNK